MVGAPVAAFATAEAPTPAVPLNATTVSDCRNDVRPCVDVTVVFVRTVGAVAFQISAVPSCPFDRFTSVQVNPAPETVAVWPPLVGPSDPTKASNTSPGAVVPNARVVCAPDP